MTVLLLCVVFTGLGLAMLEASAVHLKINGARRFAGLLDAASESGLKSGYADLAAWLGAEVRLAAVADERVEAVREAPAQAFPELLESAVGAAFPRLLEETCDGSSWTTRTGCSLESVEDRGDYLLITAAFRIESRGGLERIRSRRKSALEGTIGLLAGRLPLAAVPFYIKGDLSAGERSAFAAENGIRLAERPGQSIPPGLAASAAGVLPDDAADIAAEALRVGVFRPGDLSPARLREALGLEISADPVPDGVYLIRDDLGLGGVFVQGDLDELLLAVRGDAQTAVFRAGGLEWRLEWSPARSRTDFVSPETAESFDLVPLPILFVNGAIAALGGGVVGLDGRIELASDPDEPSVLSGVDLTIVSTEQVTIAAHLILQGVRWQDGVPYAKDATAQLVIYASGRDVLTGKAAEGPGIAIAAGAPADLKIQASLAAAGGFAIEGTDRSVELLGALQAGSYEGRGNSLVLYGDDRVAAGLLPGNGPLAAGSLLAAYSLKALTWEEY